MSSSEQTREHSQGIKQLRKIVKQHGQMMNLNMKMVVSIAKLDLEFDPFDIAAFINMAQEI